ncbi:intraflagellar transport protein 80 [Pavlovales sp. CCMP2436]|nr:intraflagellar transport protein 80 [Pavlovales sp. CCMP2436]
MKLKVTAQTSQHKEVVTAVGWSFSNDLVTCSDDKTIWRWSMSHEPIGQLIAIDAYVTSLDWFPALPGKSDRKEQEIFVVSCTDGTFKLVHKAGRIEKSVEAHTGAVISLRWSHDGTSLATCGEDGVVKTWNRNGMLRATIVSLDQPIYAIAWSPDGEQILFAAGKDMIIKPYQPSTKQTQWKGHDAAVTSVDWNVVSNLIVSGGEDCKYKIWDSFGRQLYASAPFDFAVTSVAWCPSGAYLAVGSFNLLRLCDRTGWSISRETPDSGSIYDISWTSDGTQLAAAGGNGSVCFGQLVERELAWSHFEVRLTESAKLAVYDVLTDGVDEIDFRDRVIEFSMGFGYLVVATAAQCLVYSVNNWNTPHIFDLKESVSMIKLAPRHFATVDKLTGVQVYSFEGRLLSHLKFVGLRPEFVSDRTLAISNDAAAFVDRSAPKTVHLLDCTSGKPVCADFVHSLDVEEVLLSQLGHAYERKLCVIDRNRDLYLSTVSDHPDPVKLATMVDSARWNDENDMLLAIADGKLLVWLYPQSAFTDRDLLQRTRSESDASELGKLPRCTAFLGTRASVRRSDGAVMTISVSPYPAKLSAFCAAGEWEAALRLCRYVKDQQLWACLAAMAVAGQDYNAAEVAYAAIEEVDKLKYMLYIKELPSKESRTAAVLNFQRKPDEAIQVLVQSGLIYRAIKLNVRLHQWEAALEMAVKYGTHIDSVLHYRGEFLKIAKRAETLPLFLQYAGKVEVDEAAIKQKIEADKEAERRRPGAVPYQ